ncbi:MAG TPA: carbohydrate ABC transporter permease [Chloroflexota bacterium]|jgi:multiple sugar transport system permease protein|nr:carbohydrate ABC transporter permease [Chloroflexota bacterium]
MSASVATPTATADHLAAVVPQTPARRFTTLLSRLLLYITLIVFAIVFIGPFAWLISNSLKDAAHVFDATWIPQPVYWDNYVKMFQAAPLLMGLRNSVIVAVLAVSSVVVSSSMVAYGLARLRFPGSNIVFIGVLATMMLPGAVTMVPVYLIYKQLHMVNTFQPLWVSNLFGSPFYIFLLRQFFLTIPQEIVEAARVDGANFYRIFLSIMLPLVRPAMVAVAIFEFQASWNNFMGPLIYLQDPNLRTLPLLLQIFVGSLGQGGQMLWNLLFAVSVMITIPMIVIFFMAQKYFIQGIATTGLKG